MAYLRCKVWSEKFKIEKKIDHAVPNLQSCDHKIVSLKIKNISKQ